MSDKAHIDRGLIASLRESSRPLRPDASLTTPPLRGMDAAGAWQRLQPAVEDLVARLERLEERLRRLDGFHLARAEPAGHLLFVPTATGYVVVERDGPPPRPGDEVVVDGSAYRVQRHRRSPLPADPRACLIVETVSERT